MDVTIAGETVPLWQLVMAGLMIGGFPFGCWYLWRLVREARRTGGWISTAEVIPADLVGMALLLLLLSFFVLSHIASTLIAEVGHVGAPQPGAILIMLLFQTAMYLFIAGMMNISMMRRGTKLVTFLGLDKAPRRRRALKGLLILLAVFPVMHVANGIWVAVLKFGLHVKLREQDVVNFLREGGSTMDIICLAVMAVIVAPLGEELVFRGYLQTVTKRYFGQWTAVIGTGVLFGLVHWNLAAMVALIILGMVLALAYEHTGSLATTIVMHMVFNAITVGVLVLGPVLVPEVTSPPPGPVPAPAPLPGWIMPHMEGGR